MSKLSSFAGRTLDALTNGWRDLTELLPSLLYRYCYVDNNHDYRTCLMLAGSGRGGTTWLADVINYDNSYRFLFEPFYNVRVEQCRAFADQQYLRPTDNDPTYLTAAESIFSGRIRNRWVDSHNRTMRADRRLVKDIRTNLLLGWIRVHFPDLPIILLLRHPCAVAHSRCMNRWTANLESTFLNQPALEEDYLEPFRSAMRQAETEFERHVFSWCVETYVPLMHFYPGEIFVTTYEDCVADPRSEVKRIFDFLRRPFYDEVLGALTKPSSQARYNRHSRNVSAIIAGESIVDSWKRSVSAPDVKRAMEILRLFGLDAIYGSDPMPVAGSIEHFMETHRWRTPGIPAHEAKR